MGKLQPKQNVVFPQDNIINGKASWIPEFMSLEFHGDSFVLVGEVDFRVRGTLLSEIIHFTSVGSFSSSHPSYFLPSTINLCIPVSKRKSLDKLLIHL